MFHDLNEKNTIRSRNLKKLIDLKTKKQNQVKRISEIA